MQLALWLKTDGKAAGISPKKLGKMIRLRHPDNIHRYINGQRVPSPLFMRRIRVATKDAVTHRDWLEAISTRPARKAAYHAAHGRKS
jgi:hypothetical protein